LAASHLANKTGLWRVSFTSGAVKEQHTLDAQEIPNLQISGMSQTFAHNLLTAAKGSSHCNSPGSQPKLLILDEPLSVMNSKLPRPEPDDQDMERQDHDSLIEHNMKAANLCKRVVVINFGKKMAEGLPDEIVRNQEVIKAYLGVNVNLA
jgi:branched-chain amino acid transport system ATP-binding protein